MVKRCRLTLWNLQSILLIFTPLLYTKVCCIGKPIGSIYGIKFVYKLHKVIAISDVVQTLDKEPRLVITCRYSSFISHRFTSITHVCCPCWNKKDITLFNGKFGEEKVLRVIQTKLIN